VNVILTIFVAGVVISILWFLIVLRSGSGPVDEPDRDEKSGAGPDHRF
jgi:hypothetical protein